MGKKGSWLTAAKKVLSSDSKEKKDKSTRKSKGWIWKQKSPELDATQVVKADVNTVLPSPTPEVNLTDASIEQAKLNSSEEDVEIERAKNINYVLDAEDGQAKKNHSEMVAETERAKNTNYVLDADDEKAKNNYSEMIAETERAKNTNYVLDAEDEQAQHAYSVALATAEAEAAAQEDAEVVWLTSVASSPDKSKEEISALKIQTVFRGYKERKALRAQKGSVRLKTLIQGQSVKRQATTSLRCMQTMSRVQVQVRTRRMRMSEENQALQRQLQQKREKELDKFRASKNEDNFNVSAKSKEQIEAKQQNKQEAAIRRERALAYAYSHQQTWRNSSKPASHSSMDPHNLHWGWSWLARWMAGRPWDNQGAIEKEQTSEPSSTKNLTTTLDQVRRDLNLENKSSSPLAKKQVRTPGRVSVSSPRAKRPTSAPALSSIKSPSSSVQPKLGRRHSMTGGSSTRDDESLAGSSGVPSYLNSKESAKAKSRLSQSGSTPEKDSVAGSAKKRLSFSSGSSSSATRRHSGPPKVDTVSVEE